MALEATPLIPSQASLRTNRIDAWSLIVAVNNERVLNDTLLASPAVRGNCQVITKRRFPCAGKAYNSGIDEAQHEILVFAHQDVFLPENWISNLESAIEQLSSLDPSWGVLGAFGATKDKAPELRGHCYSTGLRSVLGAPFPTPIPAQSLDELVLIVRRSSGLRFDENLPGFHLYGTDMCLQAEEQKIGSYIVSAFCIHNANGIKFLPVDFWRAYLYVRRKWMAKLPVTTCCTTVTKWCLPVARRLAVETKHRLFPIEVGTRCNDMQALYSRITRGQ